MDPKIDGGGSQDSYLEPYDQVVKVGEGWVDLEPVLLSNCQVAKWANILLDNAECRYAECRYAEFCCTQRISAIRLG